MPEHRDPIAVIRHAVQARDWRLVELAARLLAAREARDRPVARRALSTLVRRLGLNGRAEHH